MIILDSRDKRALYEQIADKLSELMLKGAFTHDERLPSVRALATELSINPNTIQRAYIELEKQGYIYSIKGRGSFVSHLDKIQSVKQDSTFGKLKKLVLEAKLSNIAMETFIEKTKLYYGEALTNKALDKHGGELDDTN